MSEGMFDPITVPIPGISADTLCAAMLRVMPTTLLRLDVIEDQDAARRLARNELLPDGTALWHRYFTPADMARYDDPRFSMSMVGHEFCTLVRNGASFPQTVPLGAPGTGFAISSSGHVLTNFHLVSSEVEFHGREEGILGEEIRCARLRAQVSAQGADGRWTWWDASAVWLVSSPPTSRAYRQGADGGWHLNEDTALLRIEPAPSSFLRLSSRRIRQGEDVWMAGFPLRSARSLEARRALGYADADGSLRVSVGRVTEEQGEDYFVSDLDGSMGNSGSPVLDSAGEVVGLFSRALGDGPRNVLEFGYTPRVQVRTRLAVEGLGLGRFLEGQQG